MIKIEIIFFTSIKSYSVNIMAFSSLFGNTNLWDLNALLSGPFPSTQHQGVFGSVDINDSPDTITFTMDVPGVSSNNINVLVNDGLMTISGTRSYDKSIVEGGYFERSYGNFSRSFRLGELADGSNVSAALDRGVLTLTVPKFESESYVVPVLDNVPVEQSDPWEAAAVATDLPVDNSTQSSLRRSKRNR